MRTNEVAELRIIVLLSNLVQVTQFLRGDACTLSAGSPGNVCHNTHFMHCCLYVMH